MAQVDLKELKGINNRNFYPEHYLNSSLATDAKNAGYDGKAIKEMRKEVELNLQALGENQDQTIRERLIDSWLTVLGFLDRHGDSNVLKDLAIGNKTYQLPVFKAFDLRTEGQLWIVSDNRAQNEQVDSSVTAGGADAVEPQTRRHRDIEHFYLQNIRVRHRSEASQFNWKDVITAIFDSDTSAAEWLLINQGDRLYLLERENWQSAEGYLEVDVGELFAVNSDDAFRVVQSHFSVGPFPIDSAESFHEKVAQNSHKKAAEVTKALRDTVRESIEIIANEVLSIHATSPIPLLKQYNLALKDQRAAAAAELFEQSLRYIYRMLFLFFTESQDQKKGALPVHARPYQLGYAIEKLRDLEGVAFQNTTGNFIQQTLERTFGIYFKGYNTDRQYVKNAHTGTDELTTNALGFSFPALGTDLFSPAKTKIFSEVILSDGTMQEVIRRLSLARVGSGKAARTHRVHYAGLGLNQLGAVYEGLLSLKPEILDEKAVLLKKEAKDPAHRYVPLSRKKEFEDEQFAVNDEGDFLVKAKGEFLLTPVGLERKFSASFYTPEVLTRFLAKEAVDTLLAKDASLERLENLKICEPAMGSGAFLNAVVDELAPRMAQFYRKKDLDKNESYRKLCIDTKKPYVTDEAPKLHDISHYVSKAKEHLMAHCVYGVDLNSTAVELAKISLWLNCLHEDGNLPFLDFKLRHGNSLVGCWLAQKQHLVHGWHHFLLPPPPAIDPHLDGTILGDKKMPFITDENEKKRCQTLKKSWSDCVESKDMTPRLDKLTKKIDALYQDHLRQRLKLKEDMAFAKTSESRQTIFEAFTSRNTAYNQIRSMMDYWCALWFWPHSKIKELPSVENYVKALEWMAEVPLAYGGSEREQQIKESGLKELSTARAVALETNFFHWDLEFAEIFADGGFDLVLGNPPWAPVRWADADFFEAEQPGINATKRDAKGKSNEYQKCLNRDQVLAPLYAEQKSKVLGLVAYLTRSNTFQSRDSSLTNTYKYFYQRFLSITQEFGVHAMIAQDGILTDDGCLEMRPSFLRELVSIFKFKNELQLFEDVHNEVNYAAWFCRRGKATPSFRLIDNLYHPSTAEKCSKEDNRSPYRGMKDEDGRFELRGHPKRVVQVDKSTLESLALFGDDPKWENAKLPVIHGQIELEILRRLAQHPQKMAHTQWSYWRRFDESGASKTGLISKKVVRSNDISDAVLTGPNIFVGNPSSKAPNIPCKNNRDFTEVNLTTIPDDYFPNTVYQASARGLKSPEYNSETSWGTVHSKEPRIIARKMVSTTGMRTLSAALLPPGPSHILTMSTLSFKDRNEMVYTSGLFNSLIYDFLMRSICGGDIGLGVFKMTPTLTAHQLKMPLIAALMVRSLRLSCISSHYADLWHEVFKSEFRDVTFNSDFKPLLSYQKLTGKWQRDTCIRDWRQREQALCEIDAIVAVLFDFDKETLLNLYRSQFGVLQKVMQDLPNQKDVDDEAHFPRYQAMARAYDECVSMVKKKEAA